MKNLFPVWCSLLCACKHVCSTMSISVDISVFVSWYRNGVDASENNLEGSLHPQLSGR